MQCSGVTTASMMVVATVVICEMRIYSLHWLLYNSLRLLSRLKHGLFLWLFKHLLKLLRQFFTSFLELSLALQTLFLIRRSEIGKFFLEVLHHFFRNLVRTLIQRWRFGLCKVYLWKFQIRERIHSLCVMLLSFFLLA